MKKRVKVLILLCLVVFLAVMLGIRWHVLRRKAEYPRMSEVEWQTWLQEHPLPVKDSLSDTAEGEEAYGLERMLEGIDVETYMGMLGTPRSVIDFMNANERLLQERERQAISGEGKYSRDIIERLERDLDIKGRLMLMLQEDKTDISNGFRDIELRKRLRRIEHNQEAWKLEQPFISIGEKHSYPAEERPDSVMKILDDMEKEVKAQHQIRRDNELMERLKRIERNQEDLQIQLEHLEHMEWLRQLEQIKHPTLKF